MTNENKSLFILNLRDFPGEIWNWHPYMEGHSRLVGGRFNKRGNLYTKLVLGCHKTSRSLHLSTRIVKVLYRSFNCIQAHILFRGSQQHIASQGVSLKLAPIVDLVGKTYNPRTREEMRIFQLLEYSSMVNLPSHPLEVLLQ